MHCEPHFVFSPFLYIIFLYKYTCLFEYKKYLEQGIYFVRTCQTQQSKHKNSNFHVKFLHDFNFLTVIFS